VRPRLLGHLRDMLAEKEQDIMALRARLRTSEEMKGHLEAQLNAGGSSFGVDRTAAMAQQQAVHAASQSEAAEKLQASQRLAEQLREQLQASQAGRAALADELERSRAEAGETRREALQLRERLASVEQQLSQQSGASLLPGTTPDEVEALRGRLAATMEQAFGLNTQLSARDADVARLERRISELEGSGVSVQVGSASVDSGHVLVSRSLFADGPSTSTTYEVNVAAVPTVLETTGAAGGSVRPLEPLRSSRRGTPPVTSRPAGGAVGSAELPTVPAPGQGKKLSSSASTGDIRPQHWDINPPPRTPQPPISPVRAAGNSAATVTPILAQGLSRSQSVPVQGWRGVSPRQQAQQSQQQQQQQPLAGFGGQRGGQALGAPLRTTGGSQNGVSLARWAVSPASTGATSAKGHPQMSSMGQPMLSPLSAPIAMGSAPNHVQVMWR